MDIAEFEATMATLTDQNRAFIHHYVFTLSKTKAAELAGYSKDCVGQYGWTLYNKPDINKCIKFLITASETPAEEVVNMVSAISKSNVMDYYVPTDVEHTPRIKVSLESLILRLEHELDLEHEFFMTRFFDKAEMAQYQLRINRITDKIAKSHIELKFNPNATKIVDGEPEMREELILDLKLLQADKKKGRVKSVSHKKDGSLSLELYSAAEAHERLLRMNGKYEKDNAQSATKIINVIVDGDKDE